MIPRQELCGNLLQVCTNGYRILGYPICMKSVRYDRNEFIFNFCIVLAEEDDFTTYKSVVQKLADLMHGLEEQNGFLSRDFSKSGEGKVYSLCEMLMEDLNNYCECMIPIGKPMDLFSMIPLLTTLSRRIKYSEHQAFPDISLSPARQGLASATLHVAIPGLHGRELGLDNAKGMSKMTLSP